MIEEQWTLTVYTMLIRIKGYSRFQVTFQNAVAKFVLNIPSYITKFGMLRGNLLSKFASC